MAAHEEIRAEPADRTLRRPRSKMVDNVSRTVIQSRRVRGEDVYLLGSARISDILSDVDTPARNLQRHHERVAFDRLPFQLRRVLRLKVFCFVSYPWFEVMGSSLISLW